MRFFVSFIVLGLFCQGETLAAPVSGSWQARLLLVLDGPPQKTILATISLENLLQFQLDLSGLQINSLTAFGTIGLEAQLLTLKYTVGSLMLTNISLFSRNIIEVENQFFQIKLIRPDPGGIVGQYLPIFYKDFVTPYAQLALLFGPTITESLTLRKKIVEIQLVISGLTLKTIGLSANVGSIAVPQWEIGAILVVSGQTVSGLTVRLEAYIGARRGLECVDKCFPELQFSQGRVVSGFGFEYARLTISNAKFSGVLVSIDTAFNSSISEGSLGLEYFQITSYYRLDPWALDVTDILYFNSDLLPSSHTLITGWSVGDAFVTAIWTDLSGGIVFALREFITGFSLRSFSVTSDLFTCASAPGCFGLTSMYAHEISLSFKSAPWDVQMLVVFSGLLRSFDKFVLTITYSEKSLSLRIGTAMQQSGLKVQEFFVGCSF